MHKNQENDLNNFSLLRRIFWPIKRQEIPKFMLLSLFMFCILFNQNVLRILKDSVLVTKIGAEIISFVKIYCVIPIAALFVILYAKMVNKFSFDKIFNILISIFVTYFFIFGFVIYPNIKDFHLDQDLTNSLMNSSPHAKWYIALFANWSYVLFYVLAELWPNIFYVLMFWQIANQVTSTNEASRFYTLLAFFGNSSLILVGGFISTMSTWLLVDINSEQNEIFLIKIFIAFVVLFSIISMFCVYIIEKNSGFHIKLKSSEPKLGLIDSFRYIMKSKYLWLMLICSASFGLCENLVEAVWNDKMKQLYPTVSSFAGFRGVSIFWTGIVIMLMTVLGNITMRYVGWVATAYIAPSIILVSGVIFFIAVIFKDSLNFIFQNLDYSSIYIIVFIGMIQNILAKGAKYSVWDSTREMLYIPLDNELKTKGKAAVDVVSSKIGKSMSGFIQAFLFTIFPFATYDEISPLMMVFFVITTIAWIMAIQKINLSYKKILKNQQKQEN